jgi:methionyl aminopeptidase
MIQLKTAEQIDGIKKSSRILVETFHHVKKFVVAGVKTKDIDKEVEKFIHSKGATPSFKGFNDFPASTCISINEQVVHGIPDSRMLEVGQIVGVDTGVNHKNYFSDAAYTFAIGKVSDEVQHLLQVTRESLYKGIGKAIVGKRLSNISNAIQKHAESHNYSVVRELVGHGVGLDVWELPQVPNYGSPGRGPKLQAGMVLALEPMINLGEHDVETEDDGWTVVTKDRKMSAHFEHTIAITNDKTEVLTEGIEG